MWTAACATGEEAYSLALLAAEAFAPAPAPVQHPRHRHLRATPSPTRAPASTARAPSATSARPCARAGCPPTATGRWSAEPLRALVTFARHNLVRDPFPPLGETPFDLILCRNVLIYFDTPTVGRVLGSFEQARAPGGKLVLGAADALCASATRIGVADAGAGRAAGAPNPAPAAGPAGARAGRARLPTAPPTTSGAGSRSSSATSRRRP